MIKAIIFDLDDTLYPEYEYVKSGFLTVSLLLKEKFGIEDGYEKLLAAFAHDTKNVFDAVLQEENVAFDDKDISELVAAYRQHYPRDIRFFDGTDDVLKKLRADGIKLGVITDGRTDTQKLKIEALEVESYVDCVIITDSLGGEQFRKPSPVAFEKMLACFKIKPENAVYVGDNPLKDFAIKQYMPINTVRLKKDEGLYRDREYKFGIKPDIIIEDIGEILNHERFFGRD